MAKRLRAWLVSKLSLDHDLARRIRDELDHVSHSNWIKKDRIERVDVYVTAFGEFRLEIHAVPEIEDVASNA